MTTTLERPTDVQRISTGVKHTFTGPIDIARGGFGLGVKSAGGGFTAARLALATVRSRYKARSSDDDASASVSDVSADGGRSWRTPALIALGIAAVLGVGGVAFKLLRTPSVPPVAPEPPRVRSAPAPTPSAPAPADAQAVAEPEAPSGATGDSSPDTADLDLGQAAAEGEEDRKRGE
ncbi:cell wall synthesis protein CwsA [Tsukamurella sp. 8F]|uniref:cell wall synthesis protein CwsA n=1 Tax=unclassified Tsukamurella TaxID=2633480 RepID=UPI0023B9A04D|nr:MULTISPECIES: cell wall synthesis protein CwsA [unclassified Tsukamurella]MDF0529384.1 cell wall synthesis protein CwsA [Tsukamurella sp. 8J]MDF0587109.1 cell wall synthesis protein CwsA [Tsukamurella sp. 8F]